MKHNTLRSDRVSFKRSKCGCDRSVIQDTVLREQNVFSCVYRPPPRTVNACATYTVSAVIEGTLLGEQCTSLGCITTFVGVIFMSIHNLTVQPCATNDACLLHRVGNQQHIT